MYTFVDDVEVFVYSRELTVSYCTELFDIGEKKEGRGKLQRKASDSAAKGWRPCLTFSSGHLTFVTLV